MLAMHWPVLGQTTEKYNINDITQNVNDIESYLYILLIPGEIWKHQNECTLGLPLRTPSDRVTETKWELQSSIRSRYMIRS